MEFSVYPCDVELEVSKLSPNEYKLEFAWEKCEEFTFSWEFPCVDIEGIWRPCAFSRRGKVAKFTVQLADSSPMATFINNGGDAVYTVALSEEKKKISYHFEVVEETALMKAEATVTTKQFGNSRNFSVIVYIDSNTQPLYKSCDKVKSWWERVCNAKPAIIPDLTREPVYSTWYSYHQKITATELEKECLRAKDMGLNTIIVDDGWQTDDNSRGYAYCGDWGVCESKIPDMKQHVENVHRLGMKYILWYSVPFVGMKSKKWDEFKNKTLYYEDFLSEGVLDPRYPDVRDYIISTYVKALREWDLDGFKLDFIQRFYIKDKNNITPEMDYECVQEAADRLMTDIVESLREIKPDIMLEFRQVYTGPSMRKYGNMFRVSDCPTDCVSNRDGIAELRMMGNNTVHSDMLMWNPDETAENAALQILNSLFGVIQYSMRLDTISEEHMKMSKFWLDFASKNRSILLDGSFRAYEPLQLFPAICADKDNKAIIGVYNINKVVDIEDFSETTVINATSKEELILRAQSAYRAKTEVYNCFGDIVKREEVRIKNGINQFAVPKSGMIKIIK